MYILKLKHVVARIRNIFLRGMFIAEFVEEW